MVKDILVWLSIAIMNSMACPENNSAGITSSSVLSTASSCPTTKVTSSTTASNTSSTTNAASNVSATKMTASSASTVTNLSTSSSTTTNAASSTSDATNQAFSISNATNSASSTPAATIVTSSASIATKTTSSTSAATNAAFSVSVATNTAFSVSAATNADSSVSAATNAAFTVSAATNTASSTPAATNVSSSVSTATNTASSTSAALTSRKPVFTSSDRFKCKLVKICMEVCQQMMFQVFSWGTTKNESTAFDKHFLEEKGWTKEQLNKRFNKSELETLKADSKGKTFDITLLYKLLPWVCENLAPAGSPKWVTAGDSLEYFLNQVKCFRNELMHENPTIDSTTFIAMVEKVNGILTNMLQAAGTLYSIDRSTAQNIINNMNYDINCIRDGILLPQDMQNYRTDLLFADLVNLMKVNGKKELKELYKRNKTTFIHPVNFIVGCNWNSEVEQVFTPLKLKKNSERRGQEYDLEYEDIILLGTSQATVVLFEGIGGAGKTTITRHLVSQWCCNYPTVKDLDTYDLLILMECRNSFSSFSELLDSLMPKTRQQFQDDDLLLIFKQQKSLILVDGFDEMNNNSRNLLNYILDFNRNQSNAQILMFSRPERLEDFYRMVQAKQYSVTHIKVGEIPEDERYAFIQRYYDELKRQRQSIGSIADLHQYMMTEGQALDHLWGLPLNLVILTVLWVSDHARIKQICTTTGLHMEFITLSINKLCQRLVYKVQFSVDEIMKRIRIFLFALSKIALETLRDDIIVALTLDQISKLRQICDRLRLPSDELIGAFLILKKSWCATDISTLMSFTHKTQQDFQASLFMNHIILGGSTGEPDDEKQKEIENVLLMTGYSLSEIHRYIRSPHQDHELILPLPETPLLTPAAVARSSCILEILKDLYKGKPHETLRMEKFHDVLLHLLHLMHMRGVIPLDTAHEIVQLLKKAGFGMTASGPQSSEWLDLLNVVAQDTVANAIADVLRSSKSHAFTNHHEYITPDNVAGSSLLFKHYFSKVIISTSCSNVKGYVDLIKALKTSKSPLIIPYLSDSEVQFYLDIMTTNNFLPNMVEKIHIEDPTKPEWEDILEILERQLVTVRFLVVSVDTSAPDNFADLVSEVLTRCKVGYYEGRVHYLGKNEIPRLKRVHLWIQDENDVLSHINKTLPNLSYLYITVPKDVPVLVLTTSPVKINWLNICFLTDRNLKWGTEVAKALQPSHIFEDRIRTINCKDSSLSPEGLLSFAQRLKDAGVLVSFIQVDSPHLKNLHHQEQEKLKRQLKSVCLRII